jgi:hypothetical protein
MSGRIEREKLCIEKMVGIYCKGVHGTEAGLCAECRDLLGYAGARIDKCPFGPRKSTCAKCTIHCYKKDMRAKVREVMRYAGPRMTYSHPWLSLMHYLDGFRKPVKKEKP